MKTWGPFTGTHIVAIIAIVMLSIGLPGTLWAVDAFSNVAIMDPLSGRKAHVFQNRSLFVTGNVSGSYVDANPAHLTYSYRTSRVVTDPGPCVRLAAPAAGKALLLNTIHLDFYTLTSNSPHVVFHVGANCGNLLHYVDATERGNVHLDFQPGLVIPNGQALWAQNIGAHVSILVTGFHVPSANLPPAGSAGAPNAGVQAAPRRR